MQMIPLILLTGYLNFFLFRQLGGTGFSLIIIGILIFFWKLFCWPKLPKVEIILSLILVLNLVWHDNNVVFLLSLVGLTILSMNNLVLWINQTPGLLSLFKLPGIYLSSISKGLEKLKSVHIYKVQTSVILGSIFGFGILGILYLLLSRGDLIFAGVLKSMFDFNIVFSINPRIIYSICLFVLFLPFIFTVKKKMENTQSAFNDFGFKQELTTAVLIVVLGFGLYLLLTWSYLFIKVPLETDLIKYGVSTYSEYVRRGFGELLLAAAFTFTILWVGISSNLHKSLQYLLAGELVVYILTVFRRVYLYQQFHGLSVARVYGSVFLIWLIFLVISLLFKKPKYLAISVALLTVMGFVNIEAYIARNNPPTVNNRIDYVYLSSMSADGYDGWKMALDHAKVILDRDWKTMKIIDSDTRREVAYASFILGNITTKYHEYINIYGSEAEINNYTNLIKSRNGGSYANPVFWRMHNPFYNKGEFYIKSENQVKFTPLDKLFSFNMTQKQAFDNFQKEYGGTGVLFDLQDKFYKARNKIVELGEVDFDFDISQGRLFE